MAWVLGVVLWKEEDEQTSYKRLSQRGERKLPGGFGPHDYRGQELQAWCSAMVIV